MTVDGGRRRGGRQGAGSGGVQSTSSADRRSDRSKSDDLDPASRAREICLRQLTVRARSRAELATVLARRGIEPDVAETVLDRLSEVGLIDDEAFAYAVVATGRANRGLARRALVADLRRRGVAEEASAAALAAVAPEDELASARELVARRKRAVHGQQPQVQVRRLTAMLARKGYPAGLVSRVVAEALADGGNLMEYADDYEMTDVDDDD